MAQAGPSGDTWRNGCILACSSLLSPWPASHQEGNSSPVGGLQGTCSLGPTSSPLQLQPKHRTPQGSPSGWAPSSLRAFAPPLPVSTLISSWSSGPTPSSNGFSVALLWPHHLRSKEPSHSLTPTPSPPALERLPIGLMGVLLISPSVDRKLCPGNLFVCFYLLMPRTWRSAQNKH